MAKRRGAALVCSGVALGASAASAPVAGADTGLTRSSPFLGYRSSVQDQYTSPPQAQASSTSPGRPTKAKKPKRSTKTSRQPRVTRSHRQAGGGSVDNERISVRRRAPSAGAVAGTVQTPHGRT